MYHVCMYVHPVVILLSNCENVSFGCHLLEGRVKNSLLHICVTHDGT